MKTKDASLPVVGNPVAWRRTEDPDQVDSVRRLDCRAYDRCLDVAAESGWRGFTCNQCTAYQAPTPTEQKRDLEGALDLLGETGLLAALAREPVFVDESEDDDNDDDQEGDDDQDADDARDERARRFGPCRCN